MAKATKGKAAQDQILRAERPPIVCPAPSPLDEHCAEIRAHHRERQFAMQQRKRNDNALGSHLRTSLGWHLGLPAAERKAIEARVAAAIEAAEKGLADPVYNEFRAVIDGTILARAPFDRIEEEAGERMVDAVEQLPVWSAWAKSVRGLGARTLGTIIGETGNLDGYASEAKVWKRLGLAVMDGRRQGGLAKNAPKADWIAHGYSRPRRSIMWVAGDVMVKQTTGVYRDLYVSRKAVELDKAAARGQVVEAASKRTKTDPAHFMSKMHVHRRAQRYVEKRLLRDLWRAWRLAPPGARPRMPDTAMDALPSAEAAAGNVSQDHRCRAASSAAGQPPHVNETSMSVPAAIKTVPQGQAYSAAGHSSVVDKTISPVPAANSVMPQGQKPSAAGQCGSVDKTSDPVPAATDGVSQDHTSLAAGQARAVDETILVVPAANLQVSQDQGRSAAGQCRFVDKTMAEMPAAIKTVPQGQTPVAAGHSGSVDKTRECVPATREEVPQGHMSFAAGHPTLVAETMAEMPAAVPAAKAVMPQGHARNAAGHRSAVDETNVLVPAANEAVSQDHANTAAGHFATVDKTIEAMPAAKPPLSQDQTLNAAGQCRSVDDTSHAVPAAKNGVLRGHESVAAGHASTVDETIAAMPAANVVVSQDQTFSAAGRHRPVDETNPGMPAAEALR